MNIWIIDDQGDHRDAAAATCAAAGHACRGFATGAQALEALAQGEHPDLLLMDFYIGAERGDRVTAAWRAAEPPGRRAVIVGFSSAASGSAAIVAAGGDVAIPKRISDGMHRELLAWFRRRGLKPTLRAG